MRIRDVECVFDGWFSINIPQNWKYETSSDLLSIYPMNAGKGAVQISFFRRTEADKSSAEIANHHLDRFINQYEIEVDIYSRKIIEAPCYIVANVAGTYQSDYIKVWTIVNQDKMLLITYICNKKTRELNTVENIIYSINFIDKTSYCNE